MGGGCIPVALVAGFLGSGKTTLLRRLAPRYAGRRILWIVNEFGALDMDGEKLRADGMESVALQGGSILCRCLAGAFKRVMGDAARRAAEGRLDGVVIEASGIARPGGLDEMLAEFRMEGTLAVSSVTCVVDPVRFPLVRKALPAVDEQVRACTQVLLNRVDTVDERRLEAVEKDLRTLTDAPIIRCVQCAPELDVLAWQPRALLGGSVSMVPDPAFPKCAVETGRMLNLAPLAAEIEAIAFSLFRCKGIVKGGPGQSDWVCIDWTSGMLQLEPCPAPAGHAGGLVFISKEGQAGPAQNLVRSIKQGRFNLPAGGNFPVA